MAGASDIHNELAIVSQHGCHMESGALQLGNGLK